ncbi:double-strand break repair helicase AddA [Roseobacter cerasinus]|uniref:DNA 3'-5' helicase n=1 Tax=Roseobacter cerasinus TaxID=2602289 RepID=A0A640VNY4_9RHOB|nr:double-strand break repair helicase AddA [Roseobacter cerasinus]GFE49372.1 double-strand break repair helicase AddA [Roseobacter cerasinus]
MTPRDDATEAQVRAARPDASTWLAANAGSGKTRVLTDRVARLLLDGVQPHHILCLTYTKAAASEMQNRLFRRLGAWAMLPEAELRASLHELGIEGDIENTRLREARTLFARAIETPGGLKIQTIHSFCAALLRRFPLEARVSPQFTEIEDRAADLLRAEIVDQMAEGADAGLIADIARFATGQDVGDLMRTIIQHRTRFAQDVTLADLLALFDQPADLSEANIERAVFQGDETDLITAILPALRDKGGNDAKAAEKLMALGPLGYGALPGLEAVFLTGPSTKSPFSAKIGSFPTKATQAVLGAYVPALDDFMRRVEDARAARLGLAAARKSLALHRFARRFVALYEEQKLLRGWLDFDDLILKARDLLTDPAVAAWVLFRIDGGIDHILVDEAQDTSPTQWDVIRKLAAEFSSGQGAREDVARTLFVVGDKKQSIYSFQGADPREFDRMHAEFKTKIEAVEQRFQSLSLAYSFRSSPAVLDVVDAAFETQSDAGFDAENRHIAFKSALPGRVDLWPVLDKRPEAEERPWYDPLDRKSPQHHMVLLAQQIASQIRQMIDTGATIPVDGPDGPAKRPVQAGDFLILVQRRSDLFAEIIRACKAHDLPIAGADRLKVGGELAVRDLAALLSFLAVAEDSLSLATALRSPLFGWSEKQLFDLAHGRAEDHLWQALRGQPEVYGDTLAVLNDLRANVDFLRPYDLIERVLTRHGGRKRLLARLGREAEDGINALLSQALAYERTAVPSLTGFLVWMETDDLEIKRQIDSASDQIRVMTIHGAKGLEAPIVILPDMGKRDIQIRDEIVQVEGQPLWKTRSAEMPPAMSDRIDEMKTAQFEERMRLLYVALTRAEKWLIVAAAGDLSKTGESFYQIVEQAVETLGPQQLRFQGLDIRRHAHGDWEDLPLLAQPSTKPPTAALDPLFNRKAPPPPDPTLVIAPTELGGAKALPGDSGRDEETAKAYGSAVHHYLEVLSGTDPSDWHRFQTPDQAEAFAEATEVVKTPALARLFNEEALAEVSLSAPWREARLSGTIDWLIIRPDSVLAVDFKTNRAVPSRPEDCPEGLLRQMGAYAHMLAEIYPRHRIETAILWTHARALMPLPHDIVTTALERAQDLDAAAPAP